METTIEKYKRSLADQNLSANTIKSYLTAVLLYNNMFGRELNKANVRDYQHYLEQHFSPTTVNVRVIAFNRFLDFAGHRRLRLRMPRIKQRHYLDNVISYADYLRFKSHLEVEKDKKWYFIVWTLAATGVRISELVRFRVEDIFNGQLDLRSKGNKVRRIYIPRKLQLQLVEWLNMQQRMEGTLFLNERGCPISIRGISKGLEYRAVRYGIDKHLVHPHAFRHLFAKKFLESKNDLTMLADLLGHESLDTTKIYLRMTSQEQHAIIDSIVEW